MVINKKQKPILKPKKLAKFTIRCIETRVIAIKKRRQKIGNFERSKRISRANKKGRIAIKMKREARRQQLQTDVDDGRFLFNILNEKSASASSDSMKNIMSHRIYTGEHSLRSISDGIKHLENIHRR